MKKSVLLFVSLMLAAVSALAQPAKPEVTFSEWNQSVEETEIYLYNVEAGMFLVASNNWGARACLVGGGSQSNIITYDKFLLGNGTISGTKWKIYAQEDRRGLTDGRLCYQLANVDKEGRGLIPNDANECWVDGGPKHDNADLRDIDGWYIVEQDKTTKTFQLNFIRKKAKKDDQNNEIKDEDGNTVYDYTPADGVLGAYKLTSDNDIATYINKDNSYSTWAIVLPAEYDRVKDDLNLYFIYQGLKQLLDKAETYGFGEGFPDQKALLTKADVTYDELKAACTKVAPAVEFAEVVAKAKEQDPTRNWSKYEGICTNPESTTTDFTNNKKFIDALLALQKVLSEGKTLDKDHNYATADELYASDDLTKQADIEAETKRVSAYVSLKKALDEAIKRNCDVTTYTAVYNKANATEAELAEAEAAVKDIIDIYDITEATASATVENPADLTHYIVNASFDKQEDFHGWSHTGDKGWGAGGTKSTNAEVYGRSFDVYQDIKNLPAGIYMVAVNGYTRYKSAWEDYIAWKADQVSETKIYLSSETNGQYFTPVKHVSEGGQSEKFGTGDNAKAYFDKDGNIITGDQDEAAKVAVSTWYTPNTMASADEYFHKSGQDGGASDRYRNEAFGPLAAGEALRIGVYNKKATGSDWSIFDDFQLFFLGNGVDAYKAWANSVPKNYNINFEGKDYYGKPEKDAYENILNTIAASEDTQEISAQILNLDKAAEAVETSKSNYAAYVELLNTAYAWVEENGGIDESLIDESFVILDTYLGAEDPADVEEYGFPNGPALYILPDFHVGGKEGILSAEKIAEETEYLKGLYNEAKKNALTDGKDLTDLIQNPNFEQGDHKVAVGWKLDDHNGTVTKELTDWKGGNTNHCAEAWNQNFDVYQEIEGLPEGLYEVSVQAFYRTASNKDAYEAYKADPQMEGAAKVLSEVYLNEFSTPVRNVMEIQFTENLAKQCYSITDDKTNDKAQNPPFTLNGMASASAAFSLTDEEKNFTMKAYGIVTDGKIRLGIRNLTGSIYDRWTLFDNFKLTFRDKNEEVAGKVLKDKADELDKLLKAHELNPIMTDPVVNAVGKELKKAQDELLDPSMYYETLISTNNALVNAQKNVEVVANYKVVSLAYSDACTALENEDDNGEEEIWEDIDAMDEESGINDGDDAYMDFTTDDLADLSDRMEKLTEKINETIEDVKAKKEAAKMVDASDENPYDATSWIVNPNMEEGDKDHMTGWEFKKKSGNGPVKQDGGIGNTRSMEVWCSKSVDVEFNFFQTISRLPAGKYELTAYAGHASNGVADDESKMDAGTAAEGRAYLCAITSSNKGGSTPVEPTKGDATNAKKYSVIFTLEEGEKVKIGFQSVGTMPYRWFMCDNFELTYYGTASVREDSEDQGKVDIDVIDVQPATVKDGKFIKDGQLIIVKDGLKYNAVGVLLP